MTLKRLLNALLITLLLIRGVVAEDDQSVDTHHPTLYPMKWKEFRKTIQSIRVNGACFYGRVPAQAQHLHRQELVDMLENVTTAFSQGQRRCKDLSAITSTIFREVESRADMAPDSSYGTWQLYKASFEGNTSRHERLVAGKWITYVRGEDGEQSFDEGTNQASVSSDLSRVRLERVWDFFHAPILNGNANTFPISLADDGKASIDTRGVHIVFDSRSGFIFSDLRGYDYEQALIERLQFQPFDVGAEIPAPRVSAHLEYVRNGVIGSNLIKLVRIFCIEGIEVNQRLGDDAFAVSAPAGSTLVRFDKSSYVQGVDGRFRRPAEILKDDSDNILKRAQRPDFGKNTPSSTQADLSNNQVLGKAPSRGALHWVLVAGNALVGLGLICYVIYRTLIRS